MPLYKELKHQPLPKVEDRVKLSNGMDLPVAELLPWPSGFLVALRLPSTALYYLASFNFTPRGRAKSGEWLWRVPAEVESNLYVVMTQ